MRRFLGPAVVLLGLLALSGVATAGSGTSPSGLVQTLEVAHSSGKPGAGTYVTVTFTLSKADGSRTAAERQVNLHLLKRLGWSWRQFPKCDAAKLLRQGPKACPKDSKVGTGSAKADARPVVSDPVGATVTAFNGKRIDGKRSFLLYFVAQITSPFLITGIETRKGFIEFPVPPIPTLPGQPNAVPIFFTLKTGGKITKTKKVGGKRRKVRISYFYNPASCTGGWPWQFDFIYENGEQLNVRDDALCSK